MHDCNYGLEEEDPIDEQRLWCLRHGSSYDRCSITLSGDGSVEYYRRELLAHLRRWRITRRDTFFDLTNAFHVYGRGRIGVEVGLTPDFEGLAPQIAEEFSFDHFELEVAFDLETAARWVYQGGECLAKTESLLWEDTKALVTNFEQEHRLWRRNPPDRKIVEPRRKDTTQYLPDEYIWLWKYILQLRSSDDLIDRAYDACRPLALGDVYLCRTPRRWYNVKRGDCLLRFDSTSCWQNVNQYIRAECPGLRYRPYEITTYWSPWTIDVGNKSD